MATGVFIP